MSSSFTFSHPIDGQFAPRYERNNKKGGVKSIKCFPQCTTGNVHGRGTVCVDKVECIADFQLLPPSETISIGRFSCAKADDNLLDDYNRILVPYHVGQTYSKDTIMANARTKDSALAPEIIGTVSMLASSSKALYTFSSKGWHYGWSGGRYKSQSHVFEAFLFVPSSMGSSMYVCVHHIRGTPFDIFSTRRADPTDKLRRRVGVHQKSDELLESLQEATTMVNKSKASLSKALKRNKYNRSSSEEDDNGNDEEEEDDDDEEFIPDQENMKLKRAKTLPHHIATKVYGNLSRTLSQPRTHENNVLTQEFYPKNISGNHYAQSPPRITPSFESSNRLIPAKPSQNAPTWKQNSGISPIKFDMAVDNPSTQSNSSVSGDDEEVDKFMQELGNLEEVFGIEFISADSDTKDHPVSIPSLEMNSTPGGYHSSPGDQIDDDEELYDFVFSKDIIASSVQTAVAETQSNQQKITNEEEENKMDVVSDFASHSTKYLVNEAQVAKEKIAQKIEQVDESLRKKALRLAAWKITADALAKKIRKQATTYRPKRSMLTAAIPPPRFSIPMAL